MQQLTRARKLTLPAMLAAAAYVAMLVCKVRFVSAAPFLEYDPKDVIITIGGFIFGPLAAFAVSAAVCLVEMVTVSSSGPIGCVMNVVASCSFACSAAFVYSRRRSVKWAFIGLASGWLLMIAVMLLWNYFLTPIYMGIPREAVTPMLLPAFLPFNAIKGGLNAGLILLIYKPVTTALRKARLMPETRGPAGVLESAGGAKLKFNAGTALIGVFVVVSCVLLILVMQKRI